MPRAVPSDVAYQPQMPLVLAHRGMAWNVDANSMAAFRTAEKAGADAIELDVRRADDGTLVVIHDALHPGPLGLPVPISWLDPGEIRTPSGRQVPTLREVARWAQGNDVKLQVELKATGYEREVVDLLEDELTLNRYTISSFHSSSVQAVEEHRPAVETVRWVRGWPLLPLTVERTMRLARESRADAVGVGVFDERPSEVPWRGVIEAADGAELGVYFGGISNAPWLKTLLAEERVDGVVTDVPTKILRARDRVYPTYPPGV